MLLKRNRKFQQYLFVLYAGEFFTTREDVIISTVLGSCVSVCLFDPVEKAGGMNHFMLPEQAEFDENQLYTKDTRYGIHAMDILVNQVLKKGAQRKNLTAKIFGGASSLGSLKSSIGLGNIRFAKKYLELERIPLESEDSGGREARKIYFFPLTGKVFLKRIFKEPYIQQVEERDRTGIQEKIREMNLRSGFIDLSEF